MYTKKIYLTKSSMIEPAIFMATAFVAGTSRFIQYFPGATKGGLLLTSGIAGATCALHDYRYHGKDFTFLRKLSAIGLGSLISLWLTQSVKGRISLSFKSNIKIVFFGGTVSVLKNCIEHSHPMDPGGKKKPSVLVPLNGKQVMIRIIAGKDISCMTSNTGSTQSGKITLIDHIYETTDG